MKMTSFIMNATQDDGRENKTTFIKQEQFSKYTNN